MASSNKFGTFGGVFTPSILTILGVIMYMRLPMIIGQAGLYATIGIIIVAHIISITTGLSVSSIATDKKVEAGGTYFMISRSMGLPLGGTLGLALFVGLSFSVSLYLIGFAESFLGFFGFEITKDNIRLAGSAILLLVTIITFISTSLALKTQYFIMAAIFLSLLSIFFGKHEFTPIEPTLTIPGGAAGLMLLFGIFFPAVTGFEAGVSMSGDLKDPKKSIPFGSISAILFGLIVYIGLVFFFSYTVESDKLANDPQILLKISRIPQLVIAGIWGATLSSALGSILGAPRILQATALDRITPRFFAKGTGKTNEPRNALLLTFLIAEAGILIGELNIIARIVSIFFITTYGFLNLSCAFESLTSADFRPSFKTPVWVSLLGSLAAMIVMIQLDFVAMLGATIILGALYVFLKRKELVLQSGDAWSSIWASLVKTGLKKLKQDRLQSRNWRPNIIMFSGDVGDRPGLVEMGKNISGRFGMVTGFHLIPSKDLVLVRNSQVEESKKDTEYFMNIHKCRDIYSGMDEVIRVYGYSGMEPNSILMGWSKNKSKKDEFLKMVDRLQKNNFNSLLLSHNSNKQAQIKRIDLWWSGWGSNLSFGLNIVRHITGSAYWKDADLRLLLVCQDSTLVDSLYFSVRKILESYRIDMEVKVINNAIERLTRNSLIIKESANSELCIIGIPDVKFDRPEKMYDEANELAGSVRNILFINASDSFESFDLLDSTALVKDQKKSKIGEKKLPDLVLSDFQGISNEIAVIDRTGFRDIDGFFNTVFATGFKECSHILSEVDNISQSLIANFEKIHSSKEKYQKEKIVAKIRNDFFFNTKNMLSEYIEEKLTNREEISRKGLQEYLQNLDALIDSLPKKLNIKHKRFEFYGNKADSRKLRNFKRRKLTAHPFAKHIYIKVKLQKISRFYLIKNRLNFIEQLLKQIRDFDLTFLAQLRNFLTIAKELIDIAEKDIASLGTSSMDSGNFKLKLNDQVHEMEQLLQDEMLSLEHSLRLEFRRTCQQLTNDLENIRINKLLKEKRKTNKYYRRLTVEISGYTDTWLEEMKNHTNRIYLDLLINATRDRIARETEDLLLNISQQVNAELINPVKKLCKKLEDSAKSTQLDKQIQEYQVGFKLNYLDDIENLSTDIQHLIDALPEEMQISDQSPLDKISGNKMKQESRILNIPVQRIVRHCIDSIYLAPLDELLRNYSSNMKKSEYHIKDHLSYLEFEIENLDEDSDYETRYMEIVTESLKVIRREEETLITFNNKLKTEIDGMIESAFEPLSSHLIVESSQKLVHLIREYQGKQTFSKVGALRMRIAEYIKSKTVRLLYSQSEGILFAKKISQETDTESPYEQLSELVDQIVPDHTIQTTIPVYYINLFSGRSSIGEDFWIERPVEEKQFLKALNRYKRSPRGGIIISGDRNCGKTALSKYLTKKYFRPDQILHIFPPWQGSDNTEDFDLAVQKAAGLGITHTSIAESIRMGSVLIIHDLELWWQRTDNGYSVITKIMDLIREYSDRFLVIVNMNAYAYKFINSLYDIEDNFMLHINCRPFDSEDLKELIMRRHRSSGLRFIYGKSSDEQVSEIKLAGIFNRIFRISGGNPGLALNIWLSMISKFSNDKLVLKTPQVPDYSALERLDENWMVILAQFVLHKRVTVEKLETILGIPVMEIKQHINSMLMCGVIVERNNDLYIINNYLNSAICNLLSKNEFI